jgi:hypothetical protein
MYRREAEAAFNELVMHARTARPISSTLFENISRKRKLLELDRAQVCADILTLDNHKNALRDVIREVDDLSREIRSISLTRVQITVVETPAEWNTYCVACGSNCHVGCQLAYKTDDLSACSAMDSRGLCRVCKHMWTMHALNCTKMKRQEVREEIPDIENLQKRQTKQQNLATRQKLKDDLNKTIAGLDGQIEQRMRDLRVVVDDLTTLVMAPFNPHYVDYLRTLHEEAKARADFFLMDKLQAEMRNYKSFIDRIGKRPGKANRPRKGDRSN